MSIQQNPRDSFKALLLNYDALLAASDAECCFSLSEREVQMLLAFVDYIGWKTRYEPTSTEIDVNLIDRWSGNLARKLMSGCCPDDETLSRFTAEGVFQTSDDGGITWVDNPGADPRNNAVENPPLPGSASDSKRCAAADNVRDLFANYRDNLVAILGASPTLVSIMAGILAFIAVITGISGAAIGISVLLMGLASLLLTLTPTEVTDAINSTVLDQFRCLVYCRMDNDGRLTYEAWLLLLTDIAAEFSDFTELFFYQTVNGMGYIGVNNAGTTGVATASDCGDCDCPTECVDFPIVIGSLVSVVDQTVVYQSAINPGTGRQEVILDNSVGAGGTGECCFVNVCTIDGATVVFFTVKCDSSSGFFTPQGLCVLAFAIWTTSGVPFTVTVEWGGHCT